MMSQIKKLNPGFFFVLVAFLVVFIPLYPKVPLFAPLASYIVRVRLEDVLVLLAVIVGLVLWLRQRLPVPRLASRLVAFYALAGGLSLLSGVFLVQTIPLIQDHLLKSLLHWLRYMEYFALLFLVYAVVKSKARIRLFVWVLVATSLLVNVYGIGQRYWQWPVYSTMNLEYADGVPLVLQSLAARVQSTFGGHYDYGAYLVILTPLSLALLYASKDRRAQIFLGLVYGLNLWGLMASASRSGVAGAVLGIGLTAILMSFSGKIDRGFLWLATKRVMVVAGFFIVMVVLFGQNLTALFQHTLKGILPDHPAVSWLISDQVLVDQYASPRPREEVPPDVYLDQPEEYEKTVLDENGQPRVVLETRAREYSQCARERGLSLCIRLEALWPQALAGFQRNPLLGSGYGTLNKTNKFDFTEADSTDNNYLRILGETGVLGLVSYFGLVLYVVVVGVRLVFVYRQSIYARVVAIGFLAGTVGLLVNAVYIDVFASSKVAFVYWALAGLVLAGLRSIDRDDKWL